MGRVLAIDPGRVRVGLAVSDPLRITAQPLEVVPAGEAVERIKALCDDLEVDQIVLGLPVTESGAVGEAAARARALGDQVSAATGLPVEEVDERYTSRLAENAMIEAGARRRIRRKNLDKIAAAMILRTYLDRPESNQEPV
ncbi:MAG: Holliday junction resolvase RuvX [Acidimicrobiia bacterium]